MLKKIIWVCKVSHPRFYSTYFYFFFPLCCWNRAQEDDVRYLNQADARDAENQVLKHTKMLKVATSKLNAPDVTDIENVEVWWAMLIILKVLLLFPYSPIPRFLICPGKQQKKRSSRRQMCQQQEMWLLLFATQLLPSHGAAVKTRLLGKHQVKPEWKCRHNPKEIAANLSHRRCGGIFLALLLFFPKIAC